MSGNADTIKDFLVSLGFDIDQAGANKFEAVLKGVTANVLKVGAVVEGAALSIVGFTTQIANGLDKIYWASQRTGASVQGIKALGYAASQTGASAESAMSSLEGLAGFMRSNPGAEGFLNRLGVQTRDASGKMRDTAAIFTGVGQKLNNMPYYRAKQYAQMLGIDENTLMAMRRGMNGFTADYQSMLQKTGFNADKAAVQSNKFMTSMRGLTSLFGIMRDKIGSNLAGGLAGSLDSLRRRILDNFPKIEETLTKVIKGVIWLANAFTRMAWRVIQAAGSVIDWWKRLDDGSKNLLKIFGALLVAWRLLNSAFLKSPIGIITTLILAIGLLYDDYKTWKEGGKSLIDWNKWEPAIEKAKKAILWLREKLLGLKDSVGGWQNSLEILATFIAGAWLSKITSAFAKLAGIPMPPWLKLWAIYAGYLVDDRHNIKDSAKSSLNYTKRNIGDALRWMGIDTDFGRNPNTVHGTPEVALDIPGNSPSQNSASANHQKFNEIAPHERDEIKNRQQAANGYLEKISDGIAKIGNLFFSPAGAAEISPNISGDPSQFAQSVKRPQATAQGKVLLDWMGPMFNKLESLYQLPAGLLKSVAITESGGNQFAISGAGAKGLFQFMDGTARDMGLRGNDVFDPEKSAQAAAKYLSQLLRQNGGDLSKALASYNWGIGNVKRYGMGLMPQETRNYIPKVMSNMPTSAPVIQQETNINIHGVSDPREAARLTVDRQKGVNSQLTQQLPAGPR
ncbi:transglycosylase SLT domain-containing protein [Salmonella enterica]|uniref:lytic transglycosylase domain-containing protein n=1 Tax=Salmonella enterica TaxID=28901 RepID=UPI000D56CC7B|nr:transglycosylase SLT domain-containing protein [Salmonella enterica]ECF7539322.1 lytic transglycosylase domain-containing protein [Salmonella enterica subsp. enterica]EDY0674300.1 transglycosylase SLT domain-containing protein [Salmonella enterica subsp. enterica serovar Brancaster]EKT5232391.1 transglycosylase SLT domain-containing protein [Salmonella enterica subsp. enterica serovar Havana]EAA7871229.1 lytic transglycosylase domain-containing protein [Salmonella enterica]EAQ6145592.1 lyti